MHSLNTNRFNLYLQQNLKLKMTKFLSLLLVVVLFSSCGEYQKVLKSNEIRPKYDLAKKMYEEKKYANAIRLFEQLAPAYRGKPEAADMYMMYAQSFYNTKQFYAAGYQFDNFASSYPRNDKAAEASFLAAKSYSKLSPVYSLDQTDTNKAIDKLQNFIDRYPSSEYLEEANLLVKSLREKVEKKVFEVAKGYHKIADYKGAIVALENFVADYPGTPYKEEALFFKFDSAYLLAINSVENKKEDRLNAAKVAYRSLTKFKEDTVYKEESAKMLAKIDSELKQFSK